MRDHLPTGEMRLVLDSEAFSAPRLRKPCEGWHMRRQWLTVGWVGLNVGRLSETQRNEGLGALKRP